MAINCKEGFKRIIKVMCIVIFIGALFIGYKDGLNSANTSAMYDLKVKNQSEKIMKLNDVIPDCYYLAEYNIYGQFGIIQSYSHCNVYPSFYMTDDFAKKYNLKLIKKSWSSYLPTILSYILGYIIIAFIIFFLIIGIIHVIFKILHWIFLGFTKKEV